jgi:hypothetical protein
LRIKLGDDRSEVISKLIGELETSASETRTNSLLSLLAEALEGYLDIEKAILSESLRRAIQNRDIPSSHSA